MRLAGVVLAAFAVSPTFATASDSDFIPGQERQIVYYSPWGDCIGNPRSPLCALDTLLSCMVRSDWGMCATIGAAGRTTCRITGVRYSVGRVTDTDSSARITFRAQVCRDDRLCGAPSRDETEELERVNGRWRFISEPSILTLACGPHASTTGLGARLWV